MESRSEILLESRELESVVDWIARFREMFISEESNGVSHIWSSVDCKDNGVLEIMSEFNARLSIMTESLVDVLSDDLLEFKMEGISSKRN